MSGLTIELARPEDGHQVMRFMREIYPTEALQHDEARWDWMYGSDGGAKLLLARSGDAVAGHLAVMSCPLMVDGEEGRLTWVYNLVVAPEYRRKGIMTQMISEAEDEFFPLAVAGANEYSIPLFRKLGWRQFTPPRRYTRVVASVPWLFGKMRKLRKSHQGRSKTPMRIAEITGRVGTYADVEVHSLTRFGREADDLRNQVSHHVAVVGRTSQCLNWRFVERPSNTYRLLGAYRGSVLSGWAVVGALEDATSARGHIVDMLYRPSDETTGRALISASSSILQTVGVSTVHCTASWHALSDLLLKTGFRAREEDYQVLTSLPLSNLASGRWHLTRGDANMDDYLFAGFTRVCERELRCSTV